jgi:hypothetical protein
MRRRSFLFLVFVFTLQVSIYGQTLKNVKQVFFIDTINVIPAIGYINCPYGREVQPNDSLNGVFLEKLRNVLPKTTKYAINYMRSDSILDQSSKEYLIKTIPKFQDLSEEVFSIIPIGESMERILERQNGRYFLVMFYQGFVQEKIGKQIAKGVALGLATAVLTGGMFAVISAPADPYLITNFLIIDKKNKCFVYFKNRYFIGSPLNEDKLAKNFRKIFDEI